MSIPPIRSPPPLYTASDQSSSTHQTSPLHPSFIPSFAPGYIPLNPCDSAETSDTLSPLRERLDSGSFTSPQSSPIIRPRASSFSRPSHSATSPERSLLMSPMPLKARRTHSRLPSPSRSPPTQRIPFPCSSPLPSSPLAGPFQSPESNSPRSLSSPSNSPGQHSPTSIHVSHPLCSPPQPAQSHFIPHGLPVQAMSLSPSRFTRTQSSTQQTFGNQQVAQLVSSSPDHPCSRRVSLGAGLPHASAPINGDSTPLNEAPIRWWGGRRSWFDDWGEAVQSQSMYDPCMDHISHSSDPDGMPVVETGFKEPGCGNPPAFQQPFRRGASPAAFLDEEIRASFDGALRAYPGPADSSLPEYLHTLTGISEADTNAVSPAVPVPTAYSTKRPPTENVSLRYSELDFGLHFVEGSAEHKALDCLPCHNPCHFPSSASLFTPDGTMCEGQEVRYFGRGDEPINQRSRRLSNASTRSSTSYGSCMSGPSQSCSHSLLMASSQSHTGTCPSLYSLGIGIEETEREQRRSKTFWARRSGIILKRQNKDLGCGGGDMRQECRCSLPKDGEQDGLLRPDRPNREHSDERDPKMCRETDPKKLVTHAHEKEAVKCPSFLSRVGSKHGDVPHARAQQVGYSRAEKCVSLAITSILPAANITMLSPVGEALLKVRESASFLGRELAPVVRDTLSVSADLLSLVPLPGLEEAAKALLSVWTACQKMDTNRLSCLRLAERCATLLYSVQCDVKETGDTTSLAEPVERLCSALLQIQTFLETQLHRPFLKRYVRRDEIARELQACNDAITEAASRFGMSIQIRTYHEVCAAAIESKRFAQEAQAILSLDHQIILRQYAMLQVQMLGEQNLTGPTSEDSKTASLQVTKNGDPYMVAGEQASGDVYGENLPTYGLLKQPPPMPGIDPFSTANKVNPIEYGPGSCLKTPTLPMLPKDPSNTTASTMSVPPTLTPTKATFVVEETNTRTTTTKTGTHPVAPILQALKEVHLAQDSVDAAADEAALRGALAGALEAHNDVEMVRCLQVSRGEIPEAAETLRRMLISKKMKVDGKEQVVPEGEKLNTDVGDTELDKKFVRSGLEAMVRLMRWGMKRSRVEGPRERKELDEPVSPSCIPELPSWTITRYEVIRTRKIGTGLFSDVYLGHWREFAVAIKVLAHNVSREAFVRCVEQWNALDHPNILPLYGASSAVGEKPWFFVSKFCGGDNLVVSLRRAKAAGVVEIGGEATVHVDLLRFMHEIARGMSYLHERGVLHGDLRATNILIDENGRCMISDFDQFEIKSEACQSYGQPKPNHIRWRAPEMLMNNGRLTTAADVYAFAICCVEILGMGELPWATLNDSAIRELVTNKDERPPIPTLSGHADVASIVANLVQSCWVRQPDLRPSFVSIATSLGDALLRYGHGTPNVYCSPSPRNRAKPPPINSTECSPADEQYETASESMRTEVDEEIMDDMVDVSLTSPGPALGNSHYMFHTDARNYADNPISTLSQSDSDRKNEENYRFIAGLSHAFHSSLTLPLWFPTHVELGAVGYLSKPKGEFVTLFNAIDPLQCCEERLRQLPSMYGYGKFEAEKREDGRRSVAQRGLDAISGFLTFRTRGDRSHQERIARQYVFPLVRGKSSAQLCVEKTVHRYLDNLDAPTMWFKHHVDLVLDVCAPRHAIQKEDLILVVGTLDAPDWAMFVSDDHIDSRAQFNVFAYREKGEPWGMYTVESAVKNANTADVGQGSFVSKVSCVSVDAVGDTVLLAGLRFERGAQEARLM